MSTDRTILVADDDGAIRTVVSQALTRAGFEVRTTGNAATLWRWAAEGQESNAMTFPELRHLMASQLCSVRLSLSPGMQKE